MRAQAGAINIGERCVASDCQRIILFRDSQFCAEHRQKTTTAGSYSNAPTELNSLDTSHALKRRSFARRGHRRVRLMSTRCSPTNPPSRDHANALVSSHAVSSSSSSSERQLSRTHLHSDLQDTRSTASTSPLLSPSNNGGGSPGYVTMDVPCKMPSSTSAHSRLQPGTQNTRDRFTSNIKDPTHSHRLPVDVSVAALKKIEIQQTLIQTTEVKRAPIALMGPKDDLRHSSTAATNTKSITQVSVPVELSPAELVCAQKHKHNIDPKNIGCPPEPCTLLVRTNNIEAIHGKKDAKSLRPSCHQSIPLKKVIKRNELVPSLGFEKSSQDEVSEISDSDMPDSSETDSDCHAISPGVSGNKPESTSSRLGKATPVPHTMTSQEKWMATWAARFDSVAFDSAIYQQSDLQPPENVVIEKLVRQKSKAASENRLFLRVNPVIHTTHNRSQKWHTMKSREIAQRPKQKAWFGKVQERKKWLRAQEIQQEEARQRAVKTGKVPRYEEPSPRSCKPLIDFESVPEDELPEDVLKNPAWKSACAYFRKSNSDALRRQLRHDSVQETERFFRKEFQKSFL